MVAPIIGESERRGRLVSHWVLRESLAPGESAAIELEDPPVAQQVTLSVQRAGTSQSPVGRPARRSEICSQAALVAAAEAASAGRTAEGIEIRPLTPRGGDERDTLVAAD